MAIGDQYVGHGGMLLTINVHGLEEVKRLLQHINTAGGSLRVFFKHVGVYFVAQTDKAFRQSGRPAKTWPELKKGTKDRKAAQGFSKLPLIKSGWLRRSFDMKVHAEKVMVGTNVGYAAPLQYGWPDRDPSPMVEIIPEDIERAELLALKYLDDLTHLRHPR